MQQAIEQGVVFAHRVAPGVNLFDAFLDLADQHLVVVQGVQRGAGGAAQIAAPLPH